MLRINHFFFHWYYKRVSEHFWQWTFIKSVKMLIQHYNHEQFCHNGAKELYKSCYKLNQKLEHEIHTIRMQQLADDSTIKDLNKIFGTDINTKDNN